MVWNSPDSTDTSDGCNDLSGAGKWQRQEGSPAQSSGAKQFNKPAVQRTSSSTNQADGETWLRIQPSIAGLSCHSESVSIVAKPTQSK